MCWEFYSNLARAAFLAATMFVALVMIIRHLRGDPWLEFWSLLQETGILVWILVCTLRALQCEAAMAASLRIWEREILTSIGLLCFGIGRVGVIYRARGLHRRGQLSALTEQTFGPQGKRGRA